ncbi:hypothetical protein SESBI_07062 [Sesbania bispinosa]|nr:hypothetical protein SESBI_07062 [Sesbania bispinosa]
MDLRTLDECVTSTWAQDGKCDGQSGPKQKWVRGPKVSNSLIQGPKVDDVMVEVAQRVHDGHMGSTPKVQKV